MVPVFFWLLCGMSILYGTLTALIYILTPKEPTNEDLSRQRHAVVVVLGDLGHSPRMTFHALSIARRGWRVTLIGYEESQLMSKILANKNIKVVNIAQIERCGSYAVYAIKRILLQHWHLLQALRRCNNVDVLLVQNPPSIPTLGVAQFFTTWLRPGTKLIIDWHNFGFTILAMKIRWKPAITIYRAYEMVFGHFAYLHLCVSKHMCTALRQSFRLDPKKTAVLYDRPFKANVTSIKSRTLLRKSLAVEAELGAVKEPWILTSTSYTADEDLSLLLAALDIYDSRKGPKLSLIVTGKGPLKKEFEEELANHRYTRVKVYCRWLSYENYLDLLSVADLGISLHKSSSGVDLPMKVVDMFGAGLPVLALNFPAMSELVTEENGRLFSLKEELADQLEAALTDEQLYARLKSGAVAESSNVWDTQWHMKLGSVFVRSPEPGETSSISSISSLSGDDSDGLSN